MTWLTTAGSAGGSFAPTEAATYFFDRLRAASVVLESDVTVVTTGAARLAVPRVLSDANVAWTSEGAEITPSDPGADTVTATPRALKALIYASNELVDDSNPDAQNVLAMNLARATALKLDAGLLVGSGTPPEIRGLRNQSGIQTVSMGTNGAAPTNLDPFADALGLLAEADALRPMDIEAGGDDPGPAAIVMHPRNWRTISKIKEVAGSAKPVVVEGAGSPTGRVVRSIYGVPVFLSSQLPINETQGTSNVTNSAFVYDREQVVVVLRQDATVETSRDAAFSSDRTAVRVVLRADLVLPNPAAVVRIQGLLP
jgi:HK97 family phage major capsid protein